MVKVPFTLSQNYDLTKEKSQQYQRHLSGYDSYNILYHIALDGDAVSQVAIMS